MRHLLLPLLLLLTACANIAGDKYPYPPQFVTTEDVCPCKLGAFPANGSKEHQREIVGIIATQAQLSDAEKAEIMAEDHISASMMVTPVLGETVSEATHPALFTLLKHAASDTWRIGDETQEFWGRKRPWVTDDRVKLLVKPITRPSYPSGHSTTNHVWAHVLSELYPAQRKAFFARANEIGMHRVAAGVHHPSDVKAGKRLAASIFNEMQRNPQFQNELNAAREELMSAPKTPANDNRKAAPAANCNAAPTTHQMRACLR